MPAFCRNRHFVLSGYILCHSEMLYPLQLFHLQRSRMQIIALLRVVRDQQHGAAGGAAGKRFILPNAQVMIHQPMGGTGDGHTQQTDIQIMAP